MSPPPFWLGALQKLAISSAYVLGGLAALVALLVARRLYVHIGLMEAAAAAPRSLA